MGKRVTVQKPKMPQIDIRVLRDPGERTMKFVGFLPVVFYVLVAGFAMWLVPRPPIGLDLLIWLGLGGVMLLGMVGRQRVQAFDPFVQALHRGENIVLGQGYRGDERSHRPDRAGEDALHREDLAEIEAKHVGCRQHAQMARAMSLSSLPSSHCQPS